MCVAYGKASKAIRWFGGFVCGGEKGKEGKGRRLSLNCRSVTVIAEIARIYKNWQPHQQVLINELCLRVRLRPVSTEAECLLKAILYHTGGTHVPVYGLLGQNR